MPASPPAARLTAALTPLLALALVSVSPVAANADGKGIRFWNLTSETVSKLQMSPAGQDAWGPDQCRNDPDGAVDHDERLRVMGIAAGRYDVQLGYRNGRTCVVRNIEVKDNGVFSIQDSHLTDCTK